MTLRSGSTRLREIMPKQEAYGTRSYETNRRNDLCNEMPKILNATNRDLRIFAKQKILELNRFLSVWKRTHKDAKGRPHLVFKT